MLSWSSDAANNLVEAEYIIEEKAPGVRLGSVWNQWPRQLKLQLIAQVVDIENKLTTITFDKHGCIYFKEDLRSLVGEAEDIHTQSGGSDVLERFSLGPLTTNELWSGTRRDMNLDRGPCKYMNHRIPIPVFTIFPLSCAGKHALEYTRAIGHNEMMWIKTHAVSRQNYYRPNQNNEVPEDGISLLEKYMNVSSYIVPQPSDKPSSANVLWHPDLHLDNIFVDSDTCRITRIMDWQSACVAPLFYQSGVPRMCRHAGPVREGWVVPGRPEGFESLSKDEQKQIDDDLESETIHKYYEAQVYKRAPLHWAVLQQPATFTLRKPVWLVTGVWENRDLFFLREALMNITAHWSEFFPNTPCPIDFSSEDIELQSKEEENINGVGRMLLLFREQAVLPVDGMVDPEGYDLALENSRKFKDTFIGLAKDEEEKELFRNLWPY